MPTRKSIFETNSSSTHSVVSFGKTDYVKVDLKEDSVEIFEEFMNSDELESSHIDSKDWLKSAQFLHAWARRQGTQAHLDMLKKVIEDYTKRKVTFKEGGEYDSDDAYDDEEREKERRKDLEESRKEGVEDLAWAFKDKQTLKDAIFLDMVSVCEYGHD
jgi:hypothetical protein